MTDSNRESGTQNEVSAVESSQAQEVRETAEDSKAQAVQESAESPAVETNAPLGEGFEVSQAATRVWPSGACGCGPVTLVYALGALGLDYGTEARQDSIVQSMGSSNPADAYDPTKILAHLNEKPYESAAVIWTLTMESTPIYALLPEGPYADTTYDRLREFLGDQINAGVERVSIPGKISGGVRLMSGQVVPVIAPQVRGMYSWGTDALITSVCGEAPKSGKDRDAYNQKASGIRNFLQRVYFELNNLGISPQDRAMNFAATNAFQISTVFQQAIGENMVLDKIAVEKSPICRPMSDCWEVKLIFFDPTRRFETARKLYRFTIDVSDIVPATIGQVRSWSVY